MEAADQGDHALERTKRPPVGATWHRSRLDLGEFRLDKITLAPGVEPDAIAQMTPGFTGADLANLVNEAVS